MHAATLCRCVMSTRLCVIYIANAKMFSICSITVGLFGIAFFFAVIKFTFHYSEIHSNENCFHWVFNSMEDIIGKTKQSENSFFDMFKDTTMFLTHLENSFSSLNS